MKKPISIGKQDFKSLIENNGFYVDKTAFIEEWWGNFDDVTLIARPRRFGKTMNMSMVDCFFSNKYAGGGRFFEGLSIWKNEKYRELQGTYPVIPLTFSSIKENSFEKFMVRLRNYITNLYEDNRFLIESDALSEDEKDKILATIRQKIEDAAYVDCLNFLSKCLFKHFGKKVIILLDEYDTPLQEAYVSGYWEEMVSFIRGFFNATFKANDYLERALMTGITRVSKESIFSDLNNLAVITISSESYADSFGFTQDEVDAALSYYGLEGDSEEVQKWYNGFRFGDGIVIYNPWSITNYLKGRKFKAYWANTSSNSLIGKLMRQGDKEIKLQLQNLMQGGKLTVRIDEQIVFNQLDTNKQAVWSLMVATGYLKILSYKDEGDYTLELTNYEVKRMFENMVSGWFAAADSYNDFVRSLLRGDLESMNAYMNRVLLSMISYFDGGVSASTTSEPERFYHGFVLGLMVDLKDKYSITSNRKSGYGRYDILLEPKSSEYAGIIMEFKVFDSKKEKDLKETAAAALTQIEEKKYEEALKAKGIEEIRKYGFCFEGKNVLIAEG